MKQSVQLLEKESPCDFCVLAIGSLAKGEATPYSDLEYLILIEERTPESEEYFEKLAVTSYFLINSLGETTLKYMDFTELSGWFHDCAQSGFKIDGLQEEAGNIPTGNGRKETKNRFIATASELALTHADILNNPDKEKALKGDLTAMLKFTQVIYHYQKSPKNVYDEFLQLVREQTIPEQRRQISIEMLRADTTKFNFMPDKQLADKGFTVDVKKELFRFPSILLLDLAIVFDCSDENAWLTADKLHSEGHISHHVHDGLKFMLACACYIRLSAYLHHNSHNDSVSVAPKSVTLQRETDQEGSTLHHTKWFIPGGLYIPLCEVSMPIKQALSDLLSNPVQTYFVQGLKSLEIHANHWKSNFFALYSAGRYIEGLNIIEHNHDNGKFPDPPSVLAMFGSTFDSYWVLETVTDLLLQCSRYREALEFALYIDAEKSSKESKLRLGRCYLKVGQYGKALAVVPALDEKIAADALLVSGTVYKRAGNLKIAENQLVQALQMYYDEASEENMYDYYGIPIPDTSTSQHDTLKPDLIRCTAGDRLILIRCASPNIIECLMELSSIYYRGKRYQLYTDYAKKINKLLPQVYGPYALVKAAVRQHHSQAIEYNDLRDYEQSEKIFLKALSLYTEMYGSGKNHEDIAMVLTHLGVMYKTTKEYSKAEDYYLQSLSMYRQIHGEDSNHEEIANVLQDLGNMY
jgi:tetratricopeptide (TPR) repeat protein